MARRSRRRVLATAGSLVLAGCTFSRSDGDEGGEGTGETPEVTDTPTGSPEGNDTDESDGNGSDERSATDDLETETEPTDESGTDTETGSTDGEAGGEPETETNGTEADGEDDGEDGENGDDSGAPTDTPALSVETDPLVTGLEVPWDVAFGSAEAFLTERGGHLTRIETERLLSGEPIDAADLEGRREWPAESLLGVAVHPGERWVYVAAHADGETRVERFDPDAPGEREPILEGIVGDHTIGTGLAFGPGGDLWVTAGTAERDPARDPSTLGGTILRLRPDGTPSPANPGLADPRVFSYGHRNPQGVAFLPDGTPVATDHGPEGRDEIRRLRPGDDAGWPVARGGPDDPEYEAYGEEYAPPLVNTGEETWAPGGCTVYDGGAIPSWRGRLLVATLSGRHLAVVTLTPPGADLPPVGDRGRRFDADWLDDAYTATANRVLEDELGRLRGVVAAPDGTPLVLTSNRDGMTRADEPFPRERDDAVVRLRRSSRQ
ncbi:sorbosone dehydrogenase family protein [Saliphagus sp. LR7]|uniref:PQQ-dependent sugar dehydrogenase n=1 Tax=Saliphagus sp. LR7 TaxID=2282654 RepID=UPI000DF82E53|nr:PQQ-dependent sugar dehydrogenase [Saliphagus sp. LR7]